MLEQIKITSMTVIIRSCTSISANLERRAPVEHFENYLSDMQEVMNRIWIKTRRTYRLCIIVVPIAELFQDSFVVGSSPSSSIPLSSSTWLRSSPRDLISTAIVGYLENLVSDVNVGGNQNYLDDSDHKVLHIHISKCKMPGPC